MKKIILGLLLIWGFIAKAQVYNNEWIDYSKTYYKFKVGKTGLYRIPQSVLASAGLGSTQAEYFQLWRNGEQVPLYTSVASGILSSSDYIEFWGRMNDGKPDNELYRDPSWQLNDKWSLETDTSTYFLTVNQNISANLRLQTTANNVAGTSLPVDAYFMYTQGQYFKNQINPGYAVNVGEYLYSSSYDKGEGWSSSDIVTTFDTSCIGTYGKNMLIFKNLNVYKAGPAPPPTFKIAVSGNIINLRQYLAKINSDTILRNSVDFLNYAYDSTNFSVATLNSIADTVSVFNLTGSALTGCPPVDRMVIHKYEITYPRNFNFNAQTNFEFTLAPNAAGDYLQITNFSYGSSTPVLYDLTNGKRYVADLSSAPMLKFVLAPSMVPRNLVLVSEDAGNISSISTMQTRNFIDYTAPANQGDYLIITSSALITGGGNDPVNDYKAYRSSAAGGAYNVKIYLVDQIIDQFGFGIKKNPAGIRDFLMYARNKYAIAPKQIFIIGKGVNYSSQRTYEAAADIDRLNLVPTYGWPGSDILFTADPGSSLPTLSIGRLSVINPSEVAVYLKKVKEFEQAQATVSPLIKDKAWMKNVVHIIGASDEALDTALSQSMRGFRDIIADTLFGGNVTTFNKASVDNVSQLNSSTVSDLFSEGISIITYFGHSSANTFEFNLDNPQNYNNYGKYPLFIGLGCNAGDFFNYNPARLQIRETISENYVLYPNGGTIGFIASTHFGIVHYLDIWGERAYQEIGYKSYGKTLGEIMKASAADVFNYTTQEDFYARCNIEETELHGDPAVRINPHAKPDYVIEDSMVRITPNFVSVADGSFQVKADFLNIGKAPDSSIVIEVKRQLPDQSTVVVRRDTIPGIRFSGSMVLDVPVNPATDKGLNKITVSVDADNTADELYENNNTITKDVMIYDNEARPIYPYNFGIVNKQNIKLIASTANPFDTSKQYLLELDTTELFNSPLKVSASLVSKGGTIEFDPGITFTDNMVYYWRVGIEAPNGQHNWSTASFVYLSNKEEGFNQSHLYQHLKSAESDMTLDSVSRKWSYQKHLHNLFARNTMYPYGSTQEGDFVVSVDGDPFVRSACVGRSLIFNVFDESTFKPWLNVDKNGNSLNRFGSGSASCAPGRQNNFEFSYMTPQSRKLIMDFMDSIPDGAYVVVRSFDFSNNNSYSSTWRGDTALFGSNNSLYHKLLRVGFADIDSVNAPRCWALIYQKGVNSFEPKYALSAGLYDKITVSADCKTLGSEGELASPVVGPAKEWKELEWQGHSIDVSSGDIPLLSVVGMDNSGSRDTLINNIDFNQQTVNLSSINAKQYPFVQIVMKNVDSTFHSPYQLDYWRITYSTAPEGAISPNTFFQKKDTVDVAEPLDVSVAFKNISNLDFDSLKVKAIVTDKNNRQHAVPVQKHKPLAANDTLHVSIPIDTKQLAGNNNLYVEVNPNDDQPEQYHFNNSLYTTFYVRPDTLHPLLDVTFDNVHILNHDIVSSKPNILIKLRDEAKWNLLDDSSKIRIQLHKFPKGTADPGYLRDYKFDGDTLQFLSANQTVPTTNNTASAIFRPRLEDGEYELIVSGTDMSNNDAGSIQYRVAFEVINKPMISNMMNYPNPFTTSTAFVFILTGSEVPQNIRIQVLTITGKIVREILKDELGPLHIGRNITEFKWDGTDQYGQKLANGVYLYRVITNLNGKSLEKYKSSDDNTDQYFNKGYGKMYFMR